MITFLLGFAIGTIFGVAGLACVAIMYDKHHTDNKKNGRAGYYQADSRKIDIISPAQYGAFLQKRGKRR